MSSPRMRQNIWQTFEIHILAPGINSCQSTHAGLLRISLQWIKSALKLHTWKTLHPHFLQPTPNCKTRFHFPETILKAVSVKMHGLVSTCEQLPSPTPQFRAGIRHRWGTSAQHQQQDAIPYGWLPWSSTSKEISAEGWTFKSFDKTSLNSIPCQQQWDPKQNERSNCFLSWKTDPTHTENTDPKQL